MIILPSGTETRWQQAIQRNDYRTWLALSHYYMSLSRMAFADNSVYMASDLVMLSNVAHQLAVDMEPVAEFCQ